MRSSKSFKTPKRTYVPGQAFLRYSRILFLKHMKHHKRRCPEFGQLKYKYITDGNILIYILDEHVN